MTRYTVYGTEGSPFVRKVLATFAEKGVDDWELEEVDVFNPPEWFLAISPARRIPVLRVGEHTLADSSAICGYLEKAYPQPALLPAEPMDCGRTLWLEEYADTVLAARIGFGLLRTLIANPKRGMDPDVDRARKTVADDLPPLFDYLEAELGQVSGPYLLGQVFTLADIATASHLVGLWLTRVDIDPARWPELAAYAARMFERESLRVRMEAVAAQRLTESPL